MLLKFLMLIFALASLMMYFSNNAIYTILLLILIALNIAGILFSLNMEFVGFILIIVYVGAIAILFLFIVMMLQIKVQNTKVDNYSYFYILITFFITSYFFLYFKNVFNDINYFFFSKNFFIIDTFFNIQVMGQALFSYFLVLVVLAGIILLIAMIIAIVLTLNFSTLKIQEDYTYKQLSKISHIFLKNTNTNSK
jgi:NADH-quinone oxidoreductase subunit J